MVSLLHLAEIKEEGVTFQSPVDGTEMLLTPEESIGIQNRLGCAMFAQLMQVRVRIEQLNFSLLSKRINKKMGWVVVVCLGGKQSQLTHSDDARCSPTVAANGPLFIHFGVYQIA
eukprot:1161604-Pelagomonas_calceolata.AAC.2